MQAKIHIINKSINKRKIISIPPFYLIILIFLKDIQDKPFNPFGLQWN
jgi:hypothetical protein